VTEAIHSHMNIKTGKDLHHSSVF